MKRQQFNTPILFCIFNRPNVTKKTFAMIAKMKPKFLYIAADGPRQNVNGEDKICMETRKITEKITWKCKVYRLYREKNLGCGRAMSGAIDWFFNNVDKGIILEDDCLPNLYFFIFAEEMLNRYESDSTIMHISGDNFLGKSDSKLTPLFSKYPHVWGWGTWKRAWKKYDFDMNIWNKKSIVDKINTIDGGLLNKLYWTAKFDSVGYKITNTWDYQWIYANFNNNGKSVFPSINLVKNIGFGFDSTHTKKEAKNRKFLNKSYTNESVNDFEENHVFNVNSWKTLLNFLYFSIFGKAYDFFCNIYFK